MDRPLQGPISSADQHSDRIAFPYRRILIHINKSCQYTTARCLDRARLHAMAGISSKDRVADFARAVALFAKDESEVSDAFSKFRHEQAEAIIRPILQQQSSIIDPAS